MDHRVRPFEDGAKGGGISHVPVDIFDAIAVRPFRTLGEIEDSYGNSVMPESLCEARSEETGAPGDQHALQRIHHGCTFAASAAYRLIDTRSEERGVGKERKSPWGPYH